MSGFTTFDVWDQALLTNIIRRPPEGRAVGAAEDTTPLLGAQIAPLKTHPGRNAKVRVAEILPFGKGQFRAPDATPPLFRPNVAWSETLRTGAVAVLRIVAYVIITLIFLIPFISTC